MPEGRPGMRLSKPPSFADQVGTLLRPAVARPRPRPQADVAADAAGANADSKIKVNRVANHPD
jgi:hypothetical protein